VIRLLLKRGGEELLPASKTLPCQTGGKKVWKGVLFEKKKTQDIKYPHGSETGQWKLTTVGKDRKEKMNYRLSQGNGRSMGDRTGIP